MSLRTQTLRLAALWLAAFSIAATAFARDAVDYVHDIKPILKGRCYACHGALKQKSGLRLDTGTAIRKGGKNGPVVLIGQHEIGELLRRVSSKDPAEVMPPMGKPLEPEQIAIIRQWIERGAVSPIDEQPEPDPREHWAFRPPRKISLSAAPNENPIDQLIAIEQKRLGITSASPAPPEVLLRRVYLDLTGLPPTREALAAFLADPSPAAYERVAEQLLDSPQYGERWARHWMDIWRYSDWYGRRKEKDCLHSFHNIWRWRDWIIKSLNGNHGYDRMIMEMLAGDEMAPGDDDAMAATGFIVRNWYRWNTDQWSRDLVEHTGKAFLGLRTNCALCHDHKYDPISQHEYFSLKAFFEPLEVRYDRVPGGPALEKLRHYEPGVYEKQIPIEPGRVGIYEAFPDQPTRLYRGGDQRDIAKDEPPIQPGIIAILGTKLPPIEAVELPMAAWYPASQAWVQREERERLDKLVNDAIEGQAVAMDEAITDPRQQDLVQLIAQQKTELLKARRSSFEPSLAADLAKFNKQPNAVDLAKEASRIERIASKLDAQRQLSRARLAAIVARTGLIEEVPATKSALEAAEKSVVDATSKLAAAQTAATQDSEIYTSFGPVYPSRSSGRRRALAQWIADKNNPLTARVAVNHIWGWHFGRPLVATPSDFGRAGATPTMPALLDWLAVEFMESGWDFKHLHRLIVTSRVYQRSSVMSETLAHSLSVDPTNKTCWKFERQRMEAEVLRDSMLSVSGQLQLTIGGPEIENTQPATIPRRSLYFSRYPEDGGTMLFTAQFDAPDVCECYKRGESLIPQQALAMVNSDVTQNASRELASKLWPLAQIAVDSVSPRHLFVRLAYQQLLCRDPRPSEQTMCESFLEEQTRLFAQADKKQAELRAAESLIRSLFSHHDFITIH